MKNIDSNLVQNNLFNYFDQFWHYKLFTIDGDSVTSANLIIALLLLVLGLWYLKSFNKGMSKYLNKKFSDDKDAANALENIISYSLIVLLFSVVLQIAHLPIKAFAFVGGALAIGIGLGAKNLINNFMSSLIILIERPVKIGDLVKIGQIEGNVLSIGTRCIKIKKFDHSEVLIPNSYVIQENLINYTLSDYFYKLNISIKFYKNAMTRIGSTFDSLNYKFTKKEIEILEREEGDSANLEIISRRVKAAIDEFSKSMVENSVNVYFKSIDEDFFIYEASFIYDRIKDKDISTLKSNIIKNITKEFGTRNLVINFEN